MQEDMNRRPRPGSADPVGSVQQARQDAATERAIGATLPDAGEGGEQPPREDAARAAEGDAARARTSDRESDRASAGRDTTPIEQAVAGAGRLDTA
ncbi:MAG: hypothetical protein BGO51_21170 [Rhodospirillales bacterium 69-11]|nr:MAG: hypothetical protein BGO51_21170 [Rhodospirillales bacterium 69-11]